MAQTKHEIQSLLAQAGSAPRQRFGQNFMIDQNLVRLVAEAGGLSGDDLAIEVGPGTGTLTDELLARAGRGGGGGDGPGLGGGGGGGGGRPAPLLPFGGGGLG